MEWVPAAVCDGVLLDLGVSSPQLDDPRRGFSFQQDGPLDMRMDDRERRTAAELVNMATVEELSRIFWEFGGERESRRFARAIALERENLPFTSTGQLAGLIERLSPRHGRKTHPATRVFQGLRIAVNDEVGQLRRGLEAALKILKNGGRLAVITFHSLEDRIVKEFSRVHSRGYTYPGEVDIPELRQPCSALLRSIGRKPVLPTEAELADNPRSRSAQLRVMEKI
jgi:16S rRNA (cytosine1402-N4)-methyltransferase